MVVIKRVMGRIDAPVLRSITFKIKGRYGSPVVTPTNPRLQTQTSSGTRSTQPVTSRGTTAVGTNQTQTPTTQSMTPTTSTPRDVNPGFDSKTWESLLSLKKAFKVKGYGFTYIPLYMLVKYAREGRNETEIEGVGKVPLFPLNITVSAPGARSLGVSVNGYPVFGRRLGSGKGIAHSYSLMVPPDAYSVCVSTDDFNAVTRVCLGTKCETVIGSGCASFLLMVNGSVE